MSDATTVKKALRALILIGSCCVGAVAMAGSTKPLVTLLHPGAHPPDTEAMILPAGSPMHLASFPRDFESNAKFHGRFTLSGAYKVQRYGEETSATIKPDKTSLKLLPYWRDHGGPDEVNISNAEAFAEAVLSPAELQALKAKKGRSPHGRITIIADDYSTSIECDVASFEARFISVVIPAVRIAANPTSEEGC
jgi:hypothetical protein